MRRTWTYAQLIKIAKQHGGSLPQGEHLPLGKAVGDLFLLIANDGDTKKGLYRYDGTTWDMICGAGSGGSVTTFVLDISLDFSQGIENPAVTFNSQNFFADYVAYVTEHNEKPMVVCRYDLTSINRGKFETLITAQRLVYSGTSINRVVFYGDTTELGEFGGVDTQEILLKLSLTAESQDGTCVIKTKSNVDPVIEFDISNVSMGKSVSDVLTRDELDSVLAGTTELFIKDKARGGVYASTDRNVVKLHRCRYFINDENEKEYIEFIGKTTLIGREEADSGFVYYMAKVNVSDLTNITVDIYRMFFNLNNGALITLTDGREIELSGITSWEKHIKSIPAYISINGILTKTIFNKHQGTGSINPPDDIYSTTIYDVDNSAYYIVTLRPYKTTLETNMKIIVSIKTITVQ